MAASHPLPEPVSYGRRLTELAAAHPEKGAIVYAAPDGAERRVSWAELDRRSSQVARLLAARGVGEGATVVVGLPNCPEHFLACFAAWKLGGLALPLRAALPAPERDALLALARPALVVAEWGELPYPTLSPADLDRAAGYADGPLPDRVPHPGRAVASGGATGRPKLVVAPGPLAARPGAYAGLFGPLGFWTFLAGMLIDIFVVFRSFFINHMPIHEQPLLFVGILLMIFGVQFILTGLQSEMIRHYAFQPGEEYSIRQELN